MGKQILYDFLGKTEMYIEKRGDAVLFSYETRHLDTGDNFNAGGIFKLENYEKGIAKLMETGHCEIEGFRPKTGVNWAEPDYPPRMIIDTKGGKMDITITGNSPNNVTLWGFDIKPSDMIIKE